MTQIEEAAEEEDMYSMLRSVSTNRTLGCVKLFCSTGISMLIIIIMIIMMMIISHLRAALARP